MNAVVLSAKLRAEARRGRRRLLQFGETGRRVGETHHKAVLTDHEVTLLLQLREENPKTHTYAWLAEKFEIAEVSVKSICSGRTRGIAAVKIKLEVVT